MAWQKIVSLTSGQQLTLASSRLPKSNDQLGEEGRGKK